MERITRGHLERQVRWLNTLGFTDISLDHYQPGDLKCCWRVENKEGSSGLGYSGRMTARECYLYLCAMIYMQEKVVPQLTQEYRKYNSRVMVGYTKCSSLTCWCRNE